MLKLPKPAIAVLLPALALVSGCGSSSSSSSGASAAASSPASTPTSGSTSSGSAAASPLSADARSAATGDIPDNQVFLRFSSRAAGFAIKYPEGWTQLSAAGQVSFRDKNNLVHVVISRAPAPTPTSVTTQLTTLKHSTPSLSFGAPKVVSLGPITAVKAVYRTRSAPNPVTGKRVTLTVDRYELAHGSRVAVVDLGTPVGVDNVDAYRLMIQSFRWL